MHIRPAQTADAEQLLAIYAYYVKNTAISFEYAVPSLEAFQNRIRTTLNNIPILFWKAKMRFTDMPMRAFLSDGQPTRGLAKQAFILTVPCKDKGMGENAMKRLKKKLQETGILNVYACIAYPERNDEFLSTGSADSHARLGFERVGIFRNCGYKFNRWYSMIWMEKIIGNHENNQKPKLMRNIPE